MNATGRSTTALPLDISLQTLSPSHEKAFLAYLCHEIRTPVSAIIGLATILSSPKCDYQKQKECADMLRDTSGLLSDLLDGMLDFSKIDAGMLKLEHQPFDIGKTAQEAMLMIALGAQKKDLTLHININDAVPNQLMGDALRIRQMMVNLLGNAMKFTTRGTIQLSINAEISEPGYYQISILVADTGIGITEEQRDVIFDKYAQAHTSISQYGGVGLGLSICKALASLMHGSIAVKSTLGIGSEFKITLELADINSGRKAA